MARKKDAMWGWVLGLGAVGAALYFTMRKGNGAAVAQPQPQPQGNGAQPPTDMYAPEPPPPPPPSPPAGPIAPYGYRPGSVYGEVIAQLPPAAPPACSRADNLVGWMGVTPDGTVRNGAYQTIEEAWRLVPEQTQSYILARRLKHTSGAECGWMLLDAVGDAGTLVALIRDEVNAQGVPVYAGLANQ